MATNLELAAIRVQEAQKEYDEAHAEHTRIERELTQDNHDLEEAKKRLSRAEGNLSQSKAQLNEAANNHANPNARRPEPEHGYRNDGTEADDDAKQPLDPVQRTQDLGARERDMKGAVPPKDIGAATTFNDGGRDRVADRTAIVAERAANESTAIVAVGRADNENPIVEDAADSDEGGDEPLETEETETDLGSAEAANEKPRKNKKKGWLSR